jgi:hypothetical protein
MDALETMLVLFGISETNMTQIHATDIRPSELWKLAPG